MMFRFDVRGVDVIIKRTSCDLRDRAFKKAQRGSSRHYRPHRVPEESTSEMFKIL